MMNALVGVLFFLLPLCSFFGEEEFIDLRTFVDQRTQQYPLPRPGKIYLSTPPRTGSTLVYNILRFLFENKDQAPFGSEYYAFKNVVIKNHETNHIPKDGLFVVTLRHPIDACASYCRALGSTIPLSDTILDAILDLYIACIKYLNQLIATHQEILILRYEDFENNHDLIFEQIERFFEIKIQHEDRVYIKQALTKENVQKNIARFSCFSEYDDLCNFHGYHIDTQELSEKDTRQIKNRLAIKMRKYANLLNPWGYAVPSTPPHK